MLSWRGGGGNTSVPLLIRILSCLEITFHYSPSQECMGSDPRPNNVILVHGLGLLEIKWPGHEAYCKNTCAYSIASHVCSGRLLPRPSAAKRIPPLSSHVSHKFAFTPKAKHNSERGPVLLKIYKLSVRSGTEAAFPLMQRPNNAKWRLRPSHRCELFLPEWITGLILLWVLCAAHCCWHHKHTEAVKPVHFVPNLSKELLA